MNETRFTMRFGDLCATILITKAQGSQSLSKVTDDSSAGIGELNRTQVVSYVHQTLHGNLANSLSMLPPSGCLPDKCPLILGFGWPCMSAADSQKGNSLPLAGSCWNAKPIGIQTLIMSGHLSDK